MGQGVCPRCQQPIVWVDHQGDFVHQCNSKVKALDEEDVLEIGTWTDYTGSKTLPPSHTSVAGINDKSRGTRAYIEHANVEDVSNRGKSKDIYRQRQHLEYIEDPDNMPNRR